MAWRAVASGDGRFLFPPRGGLGGRRLATWASPKLLTKPGAESADCRAGAAEAATAKGGSAPVPGRRSPPPERRGARCPPQALPPSAPADKPNRESGAGRGRGDRFAATRTATRTARLGGLPPADCFGQGGGRRAVFPPRGGSRGGRDSPQRGAGGGHSPNGGRAKARQDGEPAQGGRAPVGETSAALPLRQNSRAESSPTGADGESAGDGDARMAATATSPRRGTDPLPRVAVNG